MFGDEPQVRTGDVYPTTDGMRDGWSRGPRTEAPAVQTGTGTWFGLFLSLTWPALLLMPEIPKISERFKYQTLQRWIHRNKVARIQRKGIWVDFRSAQLGDQDGRHESRLKKPACEQHYKNNCFSCP